MGYKLLNLIKENFLLPPEEEEKLLVNLKVKELSKGDFFIQTGQVPMEMAFVRSGLFRYYYLNEDGTEFTKGFFPENTFLSSYSAMIENRPSYISIEALEDSVIEVVNYKSWQELLQAHSCWKDFLIYILEHAFAKKENREREFLLFDAEARYKRFLEQYPGLEPRLKQHLVASYLGITPVALSRTRKKMGLVNLG